MSNFIKFGDNDPNVVIDTWNKMISEVVSSYFLPPEKRKVCVDIGSNIGAFMGHALAQEKFEEVYGFEPAFQTYHTSLAMLKNFKLLREKVQVRNLAVTEKTGQILRLFSEESEESGNTTLIQPDKIDQEELCITVSLDDIFGILNVDYIDYLKMDCEGAEFNILYGCERIQDIGVICMEIHEGASKGARDKIENLLRNFGFWTLSFYITETKEDSDILVAINTQREDITKFRDYYGFRPGGIKTTILDLEKEKVDQGGSKLNIEEYTEWFAEELRKREK